MSERRITPSDPQWGQGRSPRSTGYRARSYYLPDDLHFRMRNAQWHTQAQPDGYDSISELVTAALWQVVIDLEERHNGGQPFPDIPERNRPKAGPSGRARQAAAVRANAADKRAREQLDGDEPTDEQPVGP